MHVAYMYYASMRENNNKDPNTIFNLFLYVLRLLMDY